MNNVKKLTVHEVPVIVMEAAKIKVLADPVALLVFSAIVVSTSKVRLRNVGGSPTSGTSYITVHGLERDTSLPQKVIKKAVQQLEKAGLLETSSYGHDSWRINEMALAAALV